MIVRQDAGLSDTIQYPGFGTGEQNPQSRLFGFFPGRHKDRKIAEFSHHLTAGPAGGDGLAGVRYHDERGEAPATCSNGGGDGIPFGANRKAVTEVFHVTATIDHSVRSQQRRTDAKSGIRCVGPVTDFPSDGNKWGEVGHCSGVYPFQLDFDGGIIKASAADKYPRR